MGATRQRIARLALLAALAGGPAFALDELIFQTPGADRDLANALAAASALRATVAEETTAPLDIAAAARAEYGRLLGILYAHGHYSGVISVRIDGREAADIPPIDTPARIGTVAVRVEPGPRFAFARARIAPLAQGTELPEGFVPGGVAESGLISGAAQAGIDGWRDVGHARARVARQDILADHARRTLSADIGLAPGPQLRFGPLRVSGQQRMRLSRILAIAGYPEGQTFSPAALELVAERLRRTGVFRSVSLVEDEAVTSPDLQGVSLALVEERPRRYTFGAEVSSLDGLAVTGSWLHRNLFGGAERLRIYGEVRQIGAQSSGEDYILGATLDRPADIRADTTGQLRFEISKLQEQDYTAESVGIGLLLTNYASRRLTWTVGVDYDWSRVQDVTGEYTYRYLSFPLGGVWEERDDPLDARSGRYGSIEVRPFLGFGGAEGGLRLKADARFYRSFGERDRVTFAVRGQAGAVFGPGLIETPRQYLFYSGGGGTVRGHPYQSLGVDATPALRTGGQAFLAASAEARVRVTDTIGVVGFVDWGHVGGLDFFDDLGGSHAGAGIGVRYDTGIGPIRLDLAAPISGDTGEGVQIYVGIGQSF